MYRLFKFQDEINTVNLYEGDIHKKSIPFDPANTDYQQFKRDVLEGAELQDADGNVMIPDEAMAFISNLP